VLQKTINVIDCTNILLNLNNTNKLYIKLFYYFKLTFHVKKRTQNYTLNNIYVKLEHVKFVRFICYNCTKINLFNSIYAAYSYSKFKALML